MRSEQEEAPTVDIWSDIVCPWCYLGKRRWEAALARFPGSERIEVRWRAFELRPGYSRTAARSLGEIMVGDWGLPMAEVQEIFARISGAGRAEGLVLRPESVRPVSTLDAHLLIKLAARRGLADPLLERLFHAYHTELANIADHDVLSSAAADAGLDRAETTALLRRGIDDVELEAVRRDRVLASEVGVTAVPSYRIGQGDAVSGALTVDELLALLSGRAPS